MRSVITLLVLLTAWPAAALEGVVTRVIDPATIEIGRQTVELDGIVATDGSAYLSLGTSDLKRLVLYKQVKCSKTGMSSTGATRAICTLADMDIAAAMVKSGYALDCPRYSRGRYSSLETAASRTKQRPAGCGR